MARTLYEWWPPEGLLGTSFLFHKIWVDLENQINDCRAYIGQQATSFYLEVSEFAPFGLVKWKYLDQYIDPMNGEIDIVTGVRKWPREVCAYLLTKMKESIEQCASSNGLKDGVNYYWANSDETTFYTGKKTVDTEITDFQSFLIVIEEIREIIDSLRWIRTLENVHFDALLKHDYHGRYSVYGTGFRLSDWSLTPEEDGVSSFIYNKFLAVAYDPTTSDSASRSSTVFAIINDNPAPFTSKLVVHLDNAAYGSSYDLPDPSWLQAYVRVLRVDKATWDRFVKADEHPRFIVGDQCFQSDGEELLYTEDLFYASNDKGRSLEYGSFTIPANSTEYIEFDMWLDIPDTSVWTHYARLSLEPGLSFYNLATNERIASYRFGFFYGVY